MSSIGEVAKVKYGFVWGNTKGTLGILSFMPAHVLKCLNFVMWDWRWIMCWDMKSRLSTYAIVSV